MAPMARDIWNNLFHEPGGNRRMVPRLLQQQADILFRLFSETRTFLPVCVPEKNNIKALYNGRSGKIY